MVTAERLPDVSTPRLRDAEEALQPYLEDASGAPAGRARGLVRARDEAEAAAFLRQAHRDGIKLLPQAARSSLTGGAIPHGEVVVSVEEMREASAPVRGAGTARATFGPGLRLREIQAGLAADGWYYPPVPTYQEAMLGGTVSTNAGGAASFKYGATRDWVHGLSVLLFNGDRLTLERGQAVARRGESFEVRLADGTGLEVPLPDYELPALKKVSAGYHAADPLDLIDLFIGAEGTLGLITSVTVDLVPLPPAVVTGLLFLPGAREGLALAGALRSAALDARHRGDPHGPDVRAIEWLDGASLDILRRHDDAKRRGIELPPDSRAGILFEMELEEPTDDRQAEALLTGYAERLPDLPDRGLVRLFSILERHAALEPLLLAFPEDARRHATLSELRELVPQRVGEILAGHRRTDFAVRKVGGDLIVPFDQLPEMIEIYERGFARRGLEFAVWGHLADGNLHPNALPRNGDEVRRGCDALLEFADEAVRRGGCPLSEHGVGRSPIKQEMLRRFLGVEAVAQMRRIKQALDPAATFAPGVIFPAA